MAYMVLLLGPAGFDVKAFFRLGSHRKCKVKSNMKSKSCILAFSHWAGAQTRDSIRELLG